MSQTSTQVDSSIGAITELVASLDATPGPAVDDTAVFENRMVETRLGVASSLFKALRQKHPPSAAHSLRVALGCSSWGFAINLDATEREMLEIGALLHDIGKIGAPDSLLLKPGSLSDGEALQMDQFRLQGLDILANCCPATNIVEIIRCAQGWFDGSRVNYPDAGDDIPLGGRMLAIVDAYDSMTTDQIYRRAMLRERALHELFSHAGTQFDSDLVRSFSELEITVPLHRKVVGHWLDALEPNASNQFWQGSFTTRSAGHQNPLGPDALFQQKLLDNMHDAVIFVDRTMRITLWNRGAERLTGIPATGVLGRHWSPRLLRMQDQPKVNGTKFDCPAAFCIENGTQVLKRLQVTGRNGVALTVNVHTLPVVGQDGATYGAAMIMHDASGEVSLEEQCQKLHERATKDPLTQVANRAQFDQTHELFVKTHIDQCSPCSLIICDIDHFKAVNDNYGHPAGDEILRYFGQLLKSACHTGDLAARYGGEEFVLLCTGCNLATATERAEQLRKTMNETPHQILGSQSVTVSFGVTEIQPGDTPASMLNRADRALLEAKRLGRNLVVQLGSGWGDGLDATTEATPDTQDGELCVRQRLFSCVPVKIALEKLKGFVVDHDAQILDIKSNRIELQIAGGSNRLGRRRADKPVPFLVELLLSEQRIPTTGADGRPAGNLSRTQVDVYAKLKRSRDRRVTDAAEQAGAIVAAIKSYLMATASAEPPAKGIARPANETPAPWYSWRK